MLNAVIRQGSALFVHILCNGIYLQDFFSFFFFLPFFVAVKF